MKQLIVQDYLTSLNEKEQLDAILPLLLTAMNFEIVSTPNKTVGIQQFGKDVIAVGTDPEDNVKTRYYFEVKGGNARNITPSNFNEQDGIRESIQEMLDVPFPNESYPGFDRLPIKVVIVHNGVVNGSIQRQFNSFIGKNFPNNVDNKKTNTWIRLGRNRRIAHNAKFERWGIERLTTLFTENLFNEYLLSSDDEVKLFKRALVLMGNNEADDSAIFAVMDSVLSKLDEHLSETEHNNRVQIAYESIKLLMYILYAYAKEENNLEPVKRALPYPILKVWSILVKHDLTGSRRNLKAFKEMVQIYVTALDGYFDRTLPIAKLEHGLWFDKAGKFEQVGYPVRVFEYLTFLCFYLRIKSKIDSDQVDFIPDVPQELFKEVVDNNLSNLPLIDIHSVTIYNTYAYLCELDIEHGKTYIGSVLRKMIDNYKATKLMPDANNNVESVMQFMVTSKKTVFYSDSTSLLLGMLAELFVANDMEIEYQLLREFVAGNNTTVALFVPFTDQQLSARHPNVNTSLEERLFSESIQQGYQLEIELPETIADYRVANTTASGFDTNYTIETTEYDDLRQLAHYFFSTPNFPNDWHE